MEKNEICSRCKGDHPNLDCLYHNIKNDNKLKCSRCGGEHYELSCVYSKRPYIN